MPSCAFVQCRNHSKRENKAKGITFHAFPQNELHRYNWIEIVRQQRRQDNWVPSKYSRVCSEHFKPTDLYVTSKGLIRVSNEAVPYFQDAMISSSQDSPTYVHNDNMDTIAPVTETPREKILKMKMRKLLNVKQRLLLDNKNLKNKNNRLNEKCMRFKETIEKLKKFIGDEQFEKVLLGNEASKSASNSSATKKEV